LRNGTLLCGLVERLGLQLSLGFSIKPRNIEECRNNIEIALDSLKKSGSLS